MRDWSSFDDIPITASLLGFSSVTLEGIYAKYCGHATPSLFMLMSYEKQYPTVRGQANRVGGCAKGFGFKVTKVTAGFKYLASVVNKLQEPIARRHEVHNTIPHVFTASVVGSIDTFPWWVQRRKGYMRQRILYAGKY